jgi:transcription elongation factor Elf1
MSFIDVKYIGLVSTQLQKFTKKKDFLYNFRCPYCGDSKKRQDKARGYIFKVKNDLVFKCHNCGVGRTFTNFLKDQNQILYDEYVLERYKEGLTGKATNTPNPTFNFVQPEFSKNIKRSINLEKISELNITHPAREYLEARKIKDIDYFYYCPKFKEWTNSQIEIFPNLKQDSPRIIIPLKDTEGKMFGYQGRSLAPKAKIRYITIMLDESNPKIFGLDRVDTTKNVYVTEGPFDSMFVDNSIAMCGSDVVLDRIQFPDCTFVYDNEPRNKQIVERIAKTIQLGDKVVIWPSNIEQKDINDMVLAGHNIQNVLKYNTYKGLEALVKFKEWKKV